MTDPKNTLTVWHATASSDAPGHVETTCQDWLAPDERDRAERFRVMTSRNQHIVGRGMARRLLSQPTDDPSEICFAEEVHGKPYVVRPDTAKQPFNIAHTDGLVVCGVGNRAHELVGVDVERLGRRTDPALADRFFSQPEIDFLNNKPNEDARRDAFLRIWTLKESFIKAIGTGLQTPLADFAFTEIDSDCPRINLLNPELESDLNWQFFSIRPREGFVGAVAVACTKRETDIQIDLCSFDDLVGNDHA